MSTPLPAALPYGIRDIKLTPYEDALGTVLGSASVDLPHIQTFSFSEAEEYTELRGDDSLVTTHGNGASVEWSLEAGGISLEAWTVLTGGTFVEGGTAPARTASLVKKGSAVRPFFRVEGQSISDSGGDLHCTVYRCKVNGNLNGDFADGTFFITSANGVGMPLLEQEEDNDLLYEFKNNETAIQTTLTPVPNPIPGGGGTQALADPQ